MRYNDPSVQEADKGWLSGLAFWSDDKDVDKVNRYQVKVGSSAERTVVTVADEKLATSAPMASEPFRG